MAILSVLHNRVIKHWSWSLKGTLNADLKICQYICLDMKIICWRFHIKTPFTCWDMRTWDVSKVCLQTLRNNRIYWKLA